MRHPRFGLQNRCQVFDKIIDISVRAFCSAEVILTISVSAANAVLIDRGATTLETSTRLEWLDLTVSQARSFDDVAGQFGAGGDFAGWRHATFSEATALFAANGFPDGYNSTQSATAIFERIQPFGQTYLDSFGGITQWGAFGNFDDIRSRTNAALQGFAGFRQVVASAGPTPNFDTAEILGDNFVTNIQAAIYGH